MLDLLIIVIFIALLTFLLWGRDNDPKAPPGPKPWPFIGNLLDMARASDNLAMVFFELGKKYGEVVSIKMGMKSTVIITSKEAMDKILSDEAAFGRDRSGVLADRTMHQNLGIATSDGEIWEKSRSWTMTKLKEFGFGKSSELEHYVQDVLVFLFQKIDSEMNEKREVNCQMIFSTPILTIIWEMMVGRLNKEDEKDIKLLAMESENFVSSTVHGAGILNAYPFLRYIFPESLGYNAQMGFYNAMNSVGKKLFLETCAKEKVPGPPRSLVEAFIENLEKDKTVFYMENFQLVFQDILLASTETTSSYLECVLLYLILHPEIQEKVYNEIVEIAPDGRPLIYADRKNMIYTQAFLLESHRHGRVLQTFIPRKALKDFYYKKYLIKKFRSPIY